LAYDEEKYYVSNTEGIDDLTGRDRTLNHYKPRIPLLPSGGLGTIPMFFDHKLVYHSFANRVSMLISNSKLRAIFTRIAQKILNKKIRDKLYVLGAFAVYYCKVDPDHIVQLILNYSDPQKDEDEDVEDKVRKKLLSTIYELNLILEGALNLSKEELQMLTKSKWQSNTRYVYDLLSRYGYAHIIDKLSQIRNRALIKAVIILMLLRDNRRDEAIQLYKTLPRRSMGLKHVIIDYEINGQMFQNKKVTHSRLGILLHNKTSKVYRIKIVK